MKIVVTVAKNPPRNDMEAAPFYIRAKTLKSAKILKNSKFDILKHKTEFSSVDLSIFCLAAKYL